MRPAIAKESVTVSAPPPTLSVAPSESAKDPTADAVAPKSRTPLLDTASVPGSRVSLRTMRVVLPFDSPSRPTTRRPKNDEKSPVAFASS